MLVPQEKGNLPSRDQGKNDFYGNHWHNLRQNQGTLSGDMVTNQQKCLLVPKAKGNSSSIDSGHNDFYGNTISDKIKERIYSGDLVTNDKRTYAGSTGKGQSVKQRLSKE